MTIRAGVRQAIGEADELCRRAHGAEHESIAQTLDGLRTTLMHADEALGGGRSVAALMVDMERMVEDLAGFMDRVGPELHEAYAFSLVRFRSLVRSLEHLNASHQIPSKPLFGVLPLARIIPQDMHSLMDYASGGLCLGSALAADSMAGAVCGAALGASAITVSALTDYRLSVAKIIPIEAHEAIDHAFGAAAIAAPFVFGYWKKDPAVAALHVITGASVILGSLFTDYRAAKGVGR